jgi:hypothetical protein
MPISLRLDFVKETKAIADILIRTKEDRCSLFQVLLPPDRDRFLGISACDGGDMRHV